MSTAQHNQITLNEDDMFDLWNEIMRDTQALIYDKLKDKALTQEQTISLMEKCTEDLYHAGWRAIQQ